MDMKKLYAEKEKEIAKSYRIQAEGLAADAQRKAAVDKVHWYIFFYYLRDNTFSIELSFKE